MLDVDKNIVRTVFLEVVCEISKLIYAYESTFLIARQTLHKLHESFMCIFIQTVTTTEWEKFDRYTETNVAKSDMIYVLSGNIEKMEMLLIPNVPFICWITNSLRTGKFANATIILINKYWLR